MFQHETIHPAMHSSNAAVWMLDVLRESDHIPDCWSTVYIYTSNL